MTAPHYAALWNGVEMAELRTELRTANARLKALGNKCSITERGELKYLQATLPSKDGSGKKQQRITLGKVSLQEAEKKGMELGHLMRSGFSWEAWEGPTKTTLTFGDFRVAGRKLYEQKFQTDSAWKKKWSPALNKLPPDSAPCTDALLIASVERLPSGTAGRRDQGNIIGQIAQVLKMDKAAIQEAARGYTAANLEERQIPKDPEIETLFKQIKLPHWRWMYAMCATYGLRPHEIVECSIDENGNCEIGDDTKTGFHIAWPCHKRWIKEFNLHDIHRPTQGKATVAKIANDYLHDRGPLPWPLYNLRHAYALRLFHKGIPSDVGARLMGHSETVHRQTYKRWYDAREINELRANYDL